MYDILTDYDSLLNTNHITKHNIIVQDLCQILLPRVCYEGSSLKTIERNTHIELNILMTDNIIITACMYF